MLSVNIHHVNEPFWLKNGYVTEMLAKLFIDIIRWASRNEKILRKVNFYH